MNLFVKLSVVTIFFLPLVAGWAGTPEEAKVVEQPPVKTTEPWVITVGAPGWLASASGHTGFHGVNPYVSVPFGQILKNINVLYSFGGEVRRERFGVLGDLLYLNAQAGTPERSGLVLKYDLSFQQFIGEFFGSYRLIEGPRDGWICWLGLDIPIWVTRWVYKPTTWQSMRRAPSWWTNSLNS
jgi:hypothetical protein